MKYNFDSIGIEVTRRCNLNCVHCCRGDAQNKDISYEVIDNLIENIETCNIINITGGEPLLAIDKIKYLVDRINSTNTTVNELYMVTNGTLKDRQIIDILSKFCDGTEKRKATLAISDDYFHNHSESMEAYSFYTDEARQNKNITIKLIDDFGGKIDNELIEFTLAGRAKTMQREHPELIPPRGVRIESLYNHRISIFENTIMCTLHITVNGDVGFFETRSYDNIDQLTIGNIQSKRMNDIIDDFNNNCMMSCRDVQMFDIWGSIQGVISDSKIFSDEKSDIIFTAKIISLIAQNIYLRVWEARRVAREKWPAIPAQIIISFIPMPSILFFMNDVLKDILSSSDEIDSKHLFGYLALIDSDLIREYNNVLKDIIADSKDAKERYDRTNEVKKSIKALALFYKPGAVIAPGKTYGTGNLSDTEEFKILEEINKKYINGELPQDNANIIQCDLVEPVIGYIQASYFKDAMEEQINRLTRILNVFELAMSKLSS